MAKLQICVYGFLVFSTFALLIFSCNEKADGNNITPRFLVDVWISPKTGFKMLFEDSDHVALQHYNKTTGHFKGGEKMLRYRLIEGKKESVIAIQSAKGNNEDSIYMLILEIDANSIKIHHFNPSNTKIIIDHWEGTNDSIDTLERIRY
ncbi:MAG: hypothetical protein ABUT20_31135 [Bacteroidota bacterium]